MKWLYRLFNQDKIDSMQRTIEVYRERTEQLEKDVREYKGYKLKYEVTKLYVEDDEALLELFELAKSKATSDDERRLRSYYAAARQQALLGGLGGLGQAQAMGMFR